MVITRFQLARIRALDRPPVGPLALAFLRPQLQRWLAVALAQAQAAEANTQVYNLLQREVPIGEDEKKVTGQNEETPPVDSRDARVA